VFLDPEQNVGEHARSETELVVGNIDFYLFRSRSPIEGAGRSRNLAGEVLAGRLDGDVGRGPDVHVAGERFGNGNP